MGAVEGGPVFPGYEIRGAGPEGWYLTTISGHLRLELDKFEEVDIAQVRADICDGCEFNFDNIPPKEARQKGSCGGVNFSGGADLNIVVGSSELLVKARCGLGARVEEIKALVEERKERLNVSRISGI